MNENNLAQGKPNNPLQTFLIYAFVAFFAMISVSSILTNDFVYDDLPLIAHNPHIRDFSNVTRFFSTDYFDLSGERTYRPVTTFTYYADAALWGIKPLGFHITSIVLHAVTTMLVFALVFRFLGSLLPALTAALLFSLHPLVVEPVAGISFREDPLAALFCAASLLLFLKWRDTKSRDWQRRFLAVPVPVLKKQLYHAPRTTHHALFLLFSWLLYLLALFSKESAGALPVLIFVLCVASRRKLPARRTILAMSGYAVAATGFIIAYFLLLHGEERLGRYPGGGPLAAVPVMAATFGQYLTHFFYPANLCLEYPAQKASWTSPNFLISGAALLFLLVSAVAARRRLPGFAFGIALFFTHLIPISNLLPFGAVMADRYMYLPMTGLCIAIGGIFGLIEGNQKIKFLNAAHKISRLLIPGVIILATTHARMNQIRTWATGETLWRKTAACCPTSPRAHTNYGIALLNAEKYEEAVAPLETAVALDPHYEALNALGSAYTHTGRWDEAVAAFSKASDRLPTSPFPPYNAGLAMLKKGDAERALQLFRKAIDIFPGFIPAIYNAGNVYLRAGQPELAIPFYKKAIAIEPGRLDARGNLAVALIHTGRPALAEEQLRYILSKEPENERARKYLSEIQQKTRP